MNNYFEKYNNKFVSQMTSIERNKIWNVKIVEKMKQIFNIDK